jgi:hypothetical protein
VSLRIALWVDRVSDPTDPVWIVSLEDDDSSETLRVCPFNEAGERTARKVAKQAATRRGIPLQVES